MGWSKDSGPLIRCKSVHANDLVEERKRLFNALFNFAHRLDFQYSCIKVKKSECPDVITMTSTEKAETNSFSRSEMEFFDNIRDFKKNYLKHLKKKSL